jgi:hypothetical protein
MPSSNKSSDTAVISDYAARFDNWRPTRLKQACNLGASNELIGLMNRALKVGKEANLDGFARDLNVRSAAEAKARQSNSELTGA